MFLFLFTVQCLRYLLEVKCRMQTTFAQNKNSQADHETPQSLPLCQDSPIHNWCWWFAKEHQWSACFFVWLISHRFLVFFCHFYKSHNSNTDCSWKITFLMTSTQDAKRYQRNLSKNIATRLVSGDFTENAKILRRWLKIF